jgi:signal transduction histidine kinase/YHS domain-containing protein
MTALLLAALAIALALNVWLIGRVMLPVRRLERQTRRLAQGEMQALHADCGGVGAVRSLQHTMASMAGHVQRAQAEGLLHRHALTEGQEAERARLARELHDDTVQSLIVVAQRIDLALHWMPNDPQRAADTLCGARDSAVESVNNLRRLIADLRPPVLAELGLGAALRLLADHDARIEVAVRGVARRLNEAHELAVFRVAQEAVRNAQRHAQASRITLDLVFEPAAVCLTVRDDGRGFSLPQLSDNGTARETHYGLLGMRERIESLHGRFELSSERGQGTVVRVALPLEDGTQPASSARDPVCGAVIRPQQAYGSLIHAGETYYFCCPVCQGAFQRDPDAYLAAPVSPGLS